MTESDKMFDFYGVCHTKFKLDDIVWEAVEDEDDGYRSYLETVRALSNGDSTFFATPIAKVKVVKVEDGYFEGYQLVDVDNGHVWLSVGTSNMDDWYPYFTFEYTPDKTQTIEEAEAETAPVLSFDDLVIN